MPQSRTINTVMPRYKDMSPMVDSNGIMSNFQFCPRIEALAGGATTLSAADSGTIYTTSGATGAVTITLPAATSEWFFIIVNGADVDLTVASATADTLITFNDIAADSVAYSTSSEKIGGGFICFADGTNPFAIPIGTGGHKQTLTVATS